MEGRDGIQKNLDRFERWVLVNIMKFNKTVCKVSSLDQDKSKHKYRQRMY